LAGGPGQRLLGGQAVPLVDDRQDHRGPGLELLAQAGLEPAVQLVLGEPADEPARRGAHGDRGHQGRRREPDQHADPTAPAEPLATQLVAGVDHPDLALLVPLHEDHALGPDLLLLDEVHELVEVLLGGLEGLVAGQDEFGRVAYGSLLALVVYLRTVGFWPSRI